MLNVDLKIISEALSEKLKKVLPDLISSQQTVYVKNRHIGESGKLISDIMETAFHSLDHNFLISPLEKYGFGKNFMSWVKILLRNQESRVLNGGTTRKYFLLGRDARQDDPISVYLFILALEILFRLIRSKPEIKGLAILQFWQVI